MTITIPQNPTKPALRVSYDYGGGPCSREAMEDRRLGENLIDVLNRDLDKPRFSITIGTAYGFFRSPQFEVNFDTQGLFWDKEEELLKRKEEEVWIYLRDKHGYINSFMVRYPITGRRVHELLCEADERCA